MAKTYKIDATDRVLGRIATEIAVLLRGKNETNFAAYKLSNNKVIVFNTAKIIYTGKKLEDKKYHRYSGYPGGITSEKLKDVIEKDPSEPLKRAVSDMLPKNTLRDKIMKNLKLYASEIK